MSARITELELALLVETAHVESLEAFMAGYKSLQPDSPTLRDSGKRYGDGDVKCVGSTLYATASDAFLTSNQAANPAQYRAD